MADVLVQLAPRGAPAFATTVELVGPTRTVTVRLDLRWLPRIGKWRIWVMTPDRSEHLAIETLVSPGGYIPTDIRDSRAPEGRLEWLGPDPYQRDDLGRTVQLVFVPRG